MICVGYSKRHTHVVRHPSEKIHLACRQLNVVPPAKRAEKRPVVGPAFRRKAARDSIHVASARNAGRRRNAEKLDKRRTGRRNAPARIVVGRVFVVKRIDGDIFVPTVLIPVVKLTLAPFADVRPKRDGHHLAGIRLGGSL